MDPIAQQATSGRCPHAPHPPNRSSQHAAMAGRSPLRDSRRERQRPGGGHLVEPRRHHRHVARHHLRRHPAHVVVWTMVKESAGVAIDAVVEHRGNARGRERKVVRVRDHARDGLVIQVRSPEVRTERCLEVRVRVDVQLQPPERGPVGSRGCTSTVPALTPRGDASARRPPTRRTAAPRRRTR